MQKDKLPSALGEALLDAVIARRPPKDYRPKRPDQPANAFINRSGEIASEIPSEATPLPPPVERDSEKQLSREGRSAE